MSTTTMVMGLVSRKLAMSETNIAKRTALTSSDYSIQPEKELVLVCKTLKGAKATEKALDGAGIASVRVGRVLRPACSSKTMPWALAHKDVRSYRPIKIWATDERAMAAIVSGLGVRDVSPVMEAKSAS